MTNLNLNIIKTTIGAETVQAVDARQLHLDLGYSISNYVQWTKNNLINSRLVLSHDYVVSPHESSTKNDYLLTINTAKHLCMMADTNVGYIMRQQYIDMEEEIFKELKEFRSKAILTSIAQSNYAEISVYFGTMYGVITTQSQRKNSGLIAYKHCMANNIAVRTRNSGYGRHVNAYPIYVLNELFKNTQ